MPDAYTYVVPLPDGITEIVTPCSDGFTIYINLKLDEQQRKNAYNHAVRHILRGDFEKIDVQEIESNAHFNAF